MDDLLQYGGKVSHEIKRLIISWQKMTSVEFLVRSWCAKVIDAFPTQRDNYEHIKRNSGSLTVTEGLEGNPFNGNIVK